MCDFVLYTVPPIRCQHMLYLTKYCVAISKATVTTKDRRTHEEKICTLEFFALQIRYKSINELSKLHVQKRVQMNGRIEFRSLKFSLEMQQISLRLSEPTLATYYK